MSERIREKSRYNLDFTSASLASPNTTGVQGGFSNFSNISKKVVTILLTALIILTGLFVANIQNAQSASAGPLEDWTCGNFAHGVFETTGRGTTMSDPEMSIVSAFGLMNDLQGTDKLTAYEMFGTAGTNFTVWRSQNREGIKDSDKITYTSPDKTMTQLDIPKSSPYWSQDFIECTGISGSLGNGVANFLLSTTEIGVTIINFVYGVATDSSSVVDPFYGEINKVIKSLQDSLYTPFITLIIMLGALWMGWQGLVKRRSTEAFQGALWMVGAAIGGALLFLNPSFIPNTANTIVSAFTQGVSSAITSNTVSNINNDLCTVDEGVEGFATKDSRIMQCAIWYNILYTPWVVGQFGTSPSAGDEKSLEILGGGGVAGEHGLTEQTLTMVDKIDIYLGDSKPIDNSQKTWPLIQLNAQALTANFIKAGDAEQKDLYARASATAVAYQQLAVNDNGTIWKGNDAFPRITTAGTSIIAMLATAILVIMFSIMIMVYEFSTIFLMLLMPIFLLIGVHPGFGRRIAMRWLEMLANLTVKRIIVVIMLAIFVMLYAVIMSMTQIWYIQNLLIVVVTIVGLSYRKKIMNAFADLDFGGDKQAFKSNEGGGVGKKVIGAAVGAGASMLAAGTVLKTLAPAAGAAAGAVGGAGSTAAGVASTAATTVAPRPTVAPSGTPSAGGPVSTPSTTPSAASTPTVTPSRNPLEQQPATNPNAAAEAQKKIDDIKKKTLKNAAIQGAVQGFTGGAKGAVLGASLTGMQMADNAHDNEVARQENEKRDAREAERSEMMRRQMDDSARAQDNLADIERQRHEEATRQRAEAERIEAEKASKNLSVSDWRSKNNLPKRNGGNPFNNNPSNGS